MNDDQLFSPRTLVALILTSLLALGGYLLMGLFSDDYYQGLDSGPSAYSVSAIGHRAFIESMRRSGRKITVSTYDSAEKASYYKLLIAAEPRDRRDLDRFMRSLNGRSRLLFVLPKRSGTPGDFNPRWLGTAALLQTSDIDTVASQFISGLKVSRPEKLTRVRFASGEASSQPDIRSPQVLKPHPGLRPILVADEGILLAGVAGISNWQFILSDPDFFNNQGLGRGQNAELTRALFHLIHPSGEIIYDTTVQGFTQKPDIWRSLITPPFIAPVVFFVFAILLLVLAALRRFGPPLKEKPEYGAGRAALYDITASLISERNEGGLLPREYAAMTLRMLSRALHLPRKFDDEQRIAAIQRIAGRRGVTGDLRQMIDDLTGPDAGPGRPALVRSAADLNRFTREMLDGEQ
jgi:hypothetical protein